MFAYVLYLMEVKLVHLETGRTHWKFKKKKYQVNIQLYLFQLFKELIRQNPKFMSKIFVVPGDCSLPDLGLSPEHRQLLSEKVNVVFHGAATVRFDENLKLAVGINVFGTQEILKFCEEMKNLKVCSKNLFLIFLKNIFYNLFLFLVYCAYLNGLYELLLKHHRGKSL